MGRVATFAALTATLLVVQTVPIAQTQRAAGDAAPVTLRGVVVDAESRAGVPRTRLDILIGSKRTAGVLTQADGSFSVEITAPDRLSIAPFASVVVKTFKSGYSVSTEVFTSEQARAPNGVRIALTRAGVITGRVIAGPNGLHPATIVFARRAGDGSTFNGNAFTAGPSRVVVSTQPDEYGNFRIGGLVPGRYTLDSPIIVVDSSGGVRTAPADGNLRLASAVVDVAAGAEVSGVNLVYEPAPDLPLLGPPAPPPPRDASVIRGRVTSTDGVPLSNAMVDVRLAGRSWAALTDASGQFTLRGLPPGSVTISATRRGYLRGEYGQRGDNLPGLPIVLEAGRDVDNVTITLSRGAVVSGVVMDDQNEPLPDVAVQLSRVRQSTAGLTLVEPTVGGLFTDDRGMFRIPQVRPGDYLLTASLPAEITTGVSGSRMAYAPAFYPDTSDAAAALPLRLQAQDDVSGVVLTIRRVPVVRVAGVVRNSQSTAFSGQVRLAHRHIGAFGVLPRIIQPDASGAFAFVEVPPGDYVLRASAAAGPNGPEVAQQALTIVDSDPAPVVMRTMPSSTVSGHFVLDAPTGELLWGYSIRTLTADTTTSAGGMTNLGSPTPNGHPFNISSLSGPTRLVVSTDSDDWYLRSITIDGVDATDVPFDFGFEGRRYDGVEVVFSRFGALATGQAIDERAAPVNDYAVHVFPTDREKWFGGSRWLKLVRSQSDGTFKVPALPPGDYWMAAVDRVDTLADSREWIDVDLLESLASRATRVTLAEGQSAPTTLRMIRR